uniref:Adhesion G protein-coupled receptor E8 n=1 Tax=Dicentrarchus labrax TaxID=13489 RepID=A0A8C4IPQ9_DICLA
YTEFVLIVYTSLKILFTYILSDIDECQTTAGICGSYSTCNNTIGAYYCTCLDGFNATDPKLPLGKSNPCKDIDECFNSTVCGPDSVCTNTPGAHTCECELGYTPTQPAEEPSETNICIDVDECDKDATVCGPNANCTNSIGSYICTCFPGFRLNNPGVIASVSNPCTGRCTCSLLVSLLLLLYFTTMCVFSLSTDTDECSETPGICGRQTVCTNVPGTFYCSCPDGFYPSTGIVWTLGVSFCKTQDDKDDGNYQSTYCTNYVRIIQKIFHPIFCIATGFINLTINHPAQSSNVCYHCVFIGQVNLKVDFHTVTGENKYLCAQYEIYIHIWKTVFLISSTVWTFPGSAAAAFMTLNGMESLLSHQYFETENRTEMYSDVITALSTFQNIYKFLFSWFHQTLTESGLGCWVAFTNENYTVCSCSHLSTFALIMQIGEDPFLEWLNRICVIVGLFFFGLAILTFLLCSWNPKINNTARLHLCLSLSLTHLLLLVFPEAFYCCQNSSYVSPQLACTVMAGLLHFLVVASFVWMLLEALQLYLLVRRLSKVQVIQRDGLPRPLLYLIGYGVPFVIVGTSALIYSDGYGATEGDVCWLSRQPVKMVYGLLCVFCFFKLNWILFCATLWSLRPTLANMKSDVSQSKDTRLIVFKIVAQFVILGCTWILGLYQTNLFFQVLFIILNSQQGTFLFIVHCVLNKEVREEYVKWLTCSFKEHREGGSVVSFITRNHSNDCKMCRIIFFCVFSLPMAIKTATLRHTKGFCFTDL